MRLVMLFAALFVASCALAEVACITNQEFFDIVKDQAEDIESFDIDDPAINDDDDDDYNVIELPGNADEELDIEYLMTKLDLANVMENIEERSPMTANNKLGWFKHIFRIFRTAKRVYHKVRRIYRTYRKVRRIYRTYRKVRRTYRKVRRTYRTYRRTKRRYRTYRRTRRRYRRYRRSGRRGRGRRRSRQTRLQNPCSCSGSSSNCCLNHTFKINLWNEKWRFRVNGDNVMNLLEYLETTVENKETDQLEEISLSDLPIQNSQLQTETTEKHLDDESQSDNEDSDDLFFEPEEFEEPEELEEPNLA